MIIWFLINVVGVKRKWYVNYTRQNFFSTSLLPFQSLLSSNNNIYWEWKGFINLYTYKLFDGMVTVDGDLLRCCVMLYINHDRITTKDCLSFLFIKKSCRYECLYLGDWFRFQFPSIRHIRKIINRRHRLCFTKRQQIIFYNV